MKVRVSENMRMPAALFCWSFFSYALIIRQQGQREQTTLLFSSDTDVFGCISEESNIAWFLFPFLVADSDASPLSFVNCTNLSSQLAVCDLKLKLSGLKYSHTHSFCPLFLSGSDSLCFIPWYQYLKVSIRESSSLFSFSISLFFIY